MGLDVNKNIVLFLFLNVKLYFNEILNLIKENIYYSKILLSSDHFNKNKYYDGIYEVFNSSF